MSRATPGRAWSRPITPSAPRTGRWSSPRAEDRQAGRLQARRARGGAGVRRALRAYFARNNARVGGTKTTLDPLPRVVLVPGLGLFGLGRIEEGRARSPPIWRECAIEAITDAEAIGRFESISEADMFDVEYWSLEQAKLGAAPRSRSPARSRSSPAPAAPSARRPPRRSPRPAPRSLCSISTKARRRRGAKALGGAALAVQCDVTDAASVRAAFDRVVRGIRRRRYRGVECGRGLAGPDRRGRRGGSARELRAELLRPPAGGAGGGEDHAGAGHRRLPAVQRVEAGGQSGTEFRALRPAQGGDAVPGAAIRARLRRRRHPRQRGQCRPHPLRTADRRFHRRARARRAASARPTICAATCSAARSPPTTWRRHSCIRRWS